MGKSIFDELERIHKRAARIIYSLAWDIPSQTIQESVKWKPLKHFYHLKLLSLVFNSFTMIYHLFRFGNYSIKEREFITL